MKIKEYQYQTEQFLPTTIERAWDFFSSPKNLSRITPPSMKFKILSTLGSQGIYNGMKIQYSVCPIPGIPLHWHTEIDHVHPGASFIDKQLKGPYKKWEHKHTFTPVENGIMMFDTIHYQIPFSYLGRLLHRVFIRKRIESIFAYRKEVLEVIF